MKRYADLKKSVLSGNLDLVKLLKPNIPKLLMMKIKNPDIMLNILKPLIEDLLM